MERGHLLTVLHQFQHSVSCRAAKTHKIVLMTVRESPEFLEEFVAAMNHGQIPVLLNPNVTNAEREKITQNIAALDPRFAHGNYFVLCTSGTTGYTKLVVHCYNNIVQTGRQYAEILQATDQDVFFSAAKMFHAYGLGNSFSIPQAVGASVVYYNGLVTAQAACEIIDGHGVTVFCGVPRHYASMVQNQTYPKKSSLRKCISAGEKLPAAIQQEFQRCTGIEIIDAVGSTEMLGFMLSNGQPVPGVDIKLVDHELLVKSSSMFLGYYNEPAHNIVNNWLCTGDLYDVENGQYVYQGRSNDLIKVNGTKVYCTAVEHEIQALPGVQECCLVKYKNHLGLEKLKLFLVCDNYTAIKASIANIGKKYRLSFLTEIKHALPRTASGKIQKYQFATQC